MNAIIDWAKLYSQGRCKAFGVSWSEEEASAVSLLGIPAEYVRRGCLTKEDYSKMKASDEGHRASGKVYLAQMRKDELMKLCHSYEIEVSDELTRATMIELLADKGVVTSIELDKEGIPPKVEVA